MDMNYRSLLHVYTSEGKLKTDKTFLAISSLPKAHKESMLNSLKTVVNELERQLKEEGR